MDNSSEVESRIGQFFDDESKEMYDQHENEGIPSSMQAIIDSVTSEPKEIVLDIGSGPGSLLLGLLENGVTKVIGMDLSEEMLNIARKRLEEKGFDNQSELIHGSFLDLQPSVQPDAITFHRVLCCHPNREGMINKAAEIGPDLITISIPRDWKFFRIFVHLYGLIAKLKGSFRPYIHSQTKIDQQFKQQGYKRKSRKKEFWWVTTTYQRIQ